MTIGAVIGAGILVLPALAAEAAGPASLVSWALMGLFALPMLAAIAQMSSRFPNSGGVAALRAAGLRPRHGAARGLSDFHGRPDRRAARRADRRELFQQPFSAGGRTRPIPRRRLWRCSPRRSITAASSFRGGRAFASSARSSPCCCYVFFARRGARGEFRAFRAARRGGRGSRDVSAFLRLSRLGDDRPSRRVQGPAARHTDKPRRRPSPS